MSLTRAQLESLLAPQKVSKAGYYRLASGELVQGKVPADLAGSFVGKVGSTKRSSNGRTVRQPDGSRKYLASDNIREEVLYYVIR